MTPGLVYLLDTNAIIEAVRTGTWAAISGGLHIETVAECVEECRRGDQLSTGYVKVGEADLRRLKGVRAPTKADVARVVAMRGGPALDPGERDLMAHAIKATQTGACLVCSPDKASVLFAVRAGFGDSLVALDDLISSVGGRASPALREHFCGPWLSSQRTRALLA